MKENIFEGAKFGDKFQMRNGWIAIYLSHYIVNDNSKLHRLCSELDGVFVVDNNGSVCQSDISNDWDIVSRYQESSFQSKVDEKKLDKLANIYSPYNFEDDDFYIQYFHPAFVEGFKAGYKKAKED